MAKWWEESSLGYRIHTNRELGLMLRGEKPLAVFTEYEERFPEAVLRYLRLFDRHVERGVLRKRVQRRKSGPVTIFYALPAQEWRIEEMIALRRNLKAWTEAHERREGELLGYTDAQNEIWLAKRRERGT